MKTLPLLTVALAFAGLITFTGCKPKSDVPKPAEQTAPAQAQANTGGDWTQWGGNDPGRNMYSPAKGLPDRFEPGKLKGETFDPATAKNVKWIAKLGSQTYGNTTVSGGKVFVGTNNDTPRDPKHQGDRSILMVFDEKTGAFLWQLVIPKLAAGKVNDWENLGLLSSPTIEGNRVYVVTSRCEVLCLTTDGLAKGNVGPFKDEAKYIAGPGKPPIEPGPKDADIVWKYDMMDELGVFPHNASNGSILIIGDILYVGTSNGQDWTHSNIPSPLSPSFIALDKKTGQLIGEDDAGISKRIFHGQWSSPSTGVVNGKPLVFFGGGDGVCYAFDAKPVKQGENNFLKTVWQFDCNPPEYKMKNGKAIKYPDSEGKSEIIATPVFYKNRVYVPTGQDPEHGEGIGHLVCLDATQTGEIKKPIWAYKGIHRSMSTVSIDPATGLLFVGDYSGFVHCLDAETGQLYWIHDMKAHMWGATLVADGKVYIGSEDGEVAVLAATKGVKTDAKERKPGAPENKPVILSKVNLGAPVYSTPIVANGVLYIASNAHLFAIYDSARANLPKP